MKAFVPILAMVVGLAFTFTPVDAQAALDRDGKARVIKQCLDYGKEYDRNNCSKCFAKGGKKQYDTSAGKGKRCQKWTPKPKPDPQIVVAIKQCMSFAKDYDRSNCSKCFAKGGKRIYKIGNPAGKRCESPKPKPKPDPAIVVVIKQCMSFAKDYDRSNCSKCFAKGGKRIYKIGNPKGKRCESATPPAITNIKKCLSFKKDYDRSNCSKCFAGGGKKYQITNPKGKRCLKR
jgi:hypothetical protein